MKRKFYLIAFSLLLVSYTSLLGQAIFAPIKGAIWNYYFKSNNYTWNIPFFKPVEGIRTIKYIKDTLINSVNFKKMEQVDKIKFRDNDTIFLNSKQDILFTQRNDSILLMTKDSLTLAFVYSERLNSTVNLKNKIQFSLTLKDTGLVSALNQPSMRFKKYVFSPSTKWIDVYLVNPLVILDKIGPFNSDITVIESQGENDTYAISYKLICYKDSETGLIKFDNRECDVLTSIIEINEPEVTEVNINQFKDYLIIKDLPSVGYIRINDIYGQLIADYSINNKNEIIIFVNSFTSGIYFINIESPFKRFKPKKILLIR